eukprot:5430691-Pleurochrysis_carterae.AAC.1
MPLGIPLGSPPEPPSPSRGKAELSSKTRANCSHESRSRAQVSSASATPPWLLEPNAADATTASDAHAAASSSK